MQRLIIMFFKAIFFTLFLLISCTVKNPNELEPLESLYIKISNPRNYNHLIVLKINKNLINWSVKTSFSADSGDFYHNLDLKLFTESLAVFFRESGPSGYWNSSGIDSVMIVSKKPNRNDTFTFEDRFHDYTYFVMDFILEKTNFYSFAMETYIFYDNESKKLKTILEAPLLKNISIYNTKDGSILMRNYGWYENFDFNYNELENVEIEIRTLSDHSHKRRIAFSEITKF
jgi:hypothetical protein